MIELLYILHALILDLKIYLEIAMMIIAVISFIVVMN